MNKTSSSEDISKNQILGLFSAYRFFGKYSLALQMGVWLFETVVVAEMHQRNPYFSSNQPTPHNAGNHQCDTISQ
jgi:hypothetical protein